MNALIRVTEDPKQLLAFIDMIGTAFAQGGLRGCKSPGQGKALAMTCIMEGLTPMQFTERYDIIDGRPTKKSITLQADFESAGGIIDWEDMGDDGKEARARFRFRNHDHVFRYTIDEAVRQVGKEKMQKPDSNWARNPGSMLRARLITKALRIVAPSVIGGAHTADELGLDGEAIDAEFQVKPAAPVTVTSSAAHTVSAPQSEPAEEAAEEATEPEASDDEISEAVEEGQRKNMDERGQELLATNDMELNPHAPPEEKEAEPQSPDQPRDDLCTANQLATLKRLVTELDFRTQFDSALAKIGVSGAKNLSRLQADKWINRLEEIKAKS